MPLTIDHMQGVLINRVAVSGGVEVDPTSPPF